MYSAALMLWASDVSSTPVEMDSRIIQQVPWGIHQPVGPGLLSKIHVKPLVIGWQKAASQSEARFENPFMLSSKNFQNWLLIGWRRATNQ